MDEKLNIWLLQTIPTKLRFYSLINLLNTLIVSNIKKKLYIFLNMAGRMIITFFFVVFKMYFHASFLYSLLLMFFFVDAKTN